MSLDTSLGSVAEIKEAAIAVPVIRVINATNGMKCDCDPRRSSQEIQILEIQK